MRPLPTALLVVLALVACRRGPEVRPGQVVVLYSSRTPHLVPPCPDGRCALVPLEGFTCPGLPAETVVVSGHGLPPLYAGHPAPEVAAAVACFRPALLVLDTCYGASTPILDALATAGVTPLVVAPPFLVPPGGFVYPPEFFAPGPVEDRARLLSTTPPAPLLRWRLDPAGLRAVHEQVERLSPAERVRRRQRTRPPLVRLPLPSALAPDGAVLVPEPSEARR